MKELILDLEKTSLMELESIAYKILMQLNRLNADFQKIQEAIARKAAQDGKSNEEKTSEKSSQET